MAPQIFFLATLFFALGLGTTITPGGLEEHQTAEHSQWVAGVENVLSNVILGPLRPEFTPAFLSKRLRESRDAIVEAQRNHLRAYVTRLMLNSLVPDGLLHVAVPAEYAPEVVIAQVQELKDHSFSVRWLSQGPGGDFVINVPRAKEK
jgi:hypothetical protein